ncbi:MULTISPECIES: 30S ribosomal protein S6 modification protein [Vibrio]|uniref:30S ribosomal protein S6 modification protein n=2 Tax=Vibrio TaxID=662 RepID=A0A7X4LMM3_9VIBR|nr:MULTISPECIES: 30S ribosomal protein S6 modification protein [Vibrio]MBF9000673.1 30S ribosomal protein S6 modification protein [Vibrio nitrifigilis]MZI94788.1 30S ribosomal protein S6 modification protein [Vibrio eleionomae]
MFNQSKLLVWYEVSSQKVILGEALSSGAYDIASLWRHVPTDQEDKSHLGYRLSLFDADGREVAAKPISVGLVDEILSGMTKARA